MTDEGGGQQEQLSRVRERIQNLVISFIKNVGTGNQFHADQLREWVSDRVAVAPGSADRILRDLRQRGYLNYSILNRKKSLYRVES